MLGEEVDIKATVSTSWESIKNTITNNSEKLRTGKFIPARMERSTFDTEDIEETHLNDDINYNSQNMLKSNKS